MQTPKSKHVRKGEDFDFDVIILQVISLLEIPRITQFVFLRKICRNRLRDSFVCANILSNVNRRALWLKVMSNSKKQFFSQQPLLQKLFFLLLTSASFPRLIQKLPNVDVLSGHLFFALKRRWARKKITTNYI